MSRTNKTQKSENIEIGNQLLFRVTEARILEIHAKIKPPEVGIPPSRRIV
jgi:hypothetical protein